MFKKALAVVSTALVAGAANAAVDTSVIEAAAADVALVGAAVFAVVIGIKVWKWMSRAS